VNICDFPQLRAITLYGNSISVFPDLSCLPVLGLLDLSYNRLTEVPKDAFKGFEQYITEVGNDISHARSGWVG
jgi:Leucine-rich repeat (LRR) protein